MSSLLSLQSAPMYGLKLPARALCSIGTPKHHNDNENSGGAISPKDEIAASVAASNHQPSSALFLVGTCSAHSENELQVIEYNEDENEVRPITIYKHTQEVWHLAASNRDASVCATTYPAQDATNSSQSTIWRLPSLAAPSSASASTPTPSPQQHHINPQLQKLTDLRGDGRVRGLVWNASEAAEESVLTIDSKGIKIWQLQEAATDAKSSVTLTSAFGSPTAASWDPHHARQLGAATESHIEFFDLRANQSQPVNSIIDAHEDLIHDLEYNPNKPFMIMSCGEDRKIHLWDLRMSQHPIAASPSNASSHRRQSSLQSSPPHQRVPSSARGSPSSSSSAPQQPTPLKTLIGHTHWAWQSKYNRFHDQLIISAGSERVNLWNIVSCSSAPVGELEAGSTGSDGLIKSYSDHEDSVYSAVWSVSDAWIFATLSYDGRIVINHVPPAEKYKILL